MHDQRNVFRRNICILNLTVGRTLRPSLTCRLPPRWQCLPAPLALDPVYPRRAGRGNFDGPGNKIPVGRGNWSADVAVFGLRSEIAAAVNW